MIYAVPAKSIRAVLVEAGNQIERLEFESVGPRVIQNCACEAIQEAIAQVDRLAKGVDVDLTALIYSLTMLAAQGAAKDATEEVIERIKGKQK